MNVFNYYCSIFEGIMLRYIFTAHDAGHFKAEIVPITIKGKKGEITKLK